MMVTNPEKARYEIERGYDPDLDVSNPGCFRFDEIHYCAARHSSCLTRGPIVMLTLALGHRGLALHLTPEGARQYATDIIAIADKLEAEHTAQANAQLAATLARKG